jgi:hypothetical protein
MLNSLSQDSKKQNIKNSKSLKSSKSYKLNDRESKLKKLFFH